MYGTDDLLIVSFYCRYCGWHWTWHYCQQCAYNHSKWWCRCF